MQNATSFNALISGVLSNSSALGLSVELQSASFALDVQVRLVRITDSASEGDELTVAVIAAANSDTLVTSVAALHC